MGDASVWIYMKAFTSFKEYLQLYKFAIDSNVLAF